MSVDGVTFARTAPAGIGMRSSTAAATWTNVTQTATVDLNPGTSYWFAFLVERAVEDAGTNDFTEGRCNMTIQVISRTGATSPLDAAASQDNAK
jgi:hypothetical protein